MAKFDDVSMPRNFNRDVHEHEILLSFTDDDGAYAFHDWWNSKGSELFYEWVKNSNEFKHLLEE